MNKEITFEAAYNKVLNFSSEYEKLLTQSKDLINSFAQVANDSDASAKKISRLTAAKTFLNTLPLPISEQQAIINQNKQLKEELEILSTAKKTLEERLSNNHKPTHHIENSLKAELDNSKKQIVILNNEIDTLKSNNTTAIENYKTEIKKLEAQIGNQEKKLLNREEELKNNNLEIEKNKEDITAGQETIILLQERIKKLSDQNILYQLEKNNLKTKLTELTLCRKFPNPNYKNEPLNEYLSRHASLNKHPENNFEHTSIPTKQLILAVSGGWLIGIIMCYLYFYR